MMRKLTVTEDNYFEIAEAVHAFCSLWYGGMGCPMYSILSRSEFKPGPLWSGSRVEEENEFFPMLTE